MNRASINSRKKEVVMLGLISSFKKVMKQRAEGAKNSQCVAQEPWEEIHDHFYGPGGMLDPNDTSSDPAFHSLRGNSWHGMFAEDD